jgi:hypothetical protein
VRGSGGRVRGSGGRVRGSGGRARGRGVKQEFGFMHLRELRSTAAAVPTRDVAMSTPLFPMPTTTTRLPSKPWGFLYLRQCEAHASDASGCRRTRCCGAPAPRTRRGRGTAA